MPVYRPTELRQFLDSLGISPKKGLSQNFLIDGNIIRKIVASANVTSSDVVLEIGPGPGSLTEELLATGAWIVAVEKDRILAQALSRMEKPGNRLSLFCVDFLQFDVKSVIPPLLASGQKAKVIANIPYNLTAPILTQLSRLPELFSTIQLMVQEEVARRCVALPGSPDYGSLSVFLQFYSTPTYLFSVSRHCFYPEPKVDSAVINLKLKKYPLEDQEDFFALTRTAFGQRRKMLRGSLRKLFTLSEINAALDKIGVSLEVRPEEISFEKWVELYWALKK